MRIRSPARQNSHRSYAARRLKLCCGVINDATSSHLGRKRAFILERERRPIIVPLNPILQGSSDPRRAGDRSNKPETSETYRPGVKSDQSPHAHSEIEEGGRGRPGGGGAFSSLHCLTPFFLPWRTDYHCCVFTDNAKSPPPPPQIRTEIDRLAARALFARSTKVMCVQREMRG